MQAMMLFAFVIYFFILTAMGIYFFHRTKSVDAYMIGDRSVPYLVTAIATQASDMGSWLFIGFPAAVFLRGIPEVWSALGLACCMFLTWHYMAHKIRIETARYKSATLNDYLSKRFDDKKGLIRLISSIACLFFFTYYIAAGLVGLGLLFEAAFDITYITGLIISIITALAYTLVGGFIAVAWTDFFQGIFLLGAIVIVPLVTLLKIGVKPIITNAQLRHIPLTLFSSEQSILASVTLALGWGLGYFGQPHILTNFMGIDNPKNIRAAKYIGMIWLIIGLTASVSIGIVSIGTIGNLTDHADELFVLLSTNLFPPLIAGFALCGVIAATLSTMDSHILLAGSVIGEHSTYQGYTHARSTVLLARCVSIVIALIALYIASSYHSATAVYSLTSYAWSGLGSTLGPSIIAALYLKRVTRQGIWAGMITGALTSALWSYLNVSLMPLIPGFFGSFALILLISYVTESSPLTNHTIQSKIKPQVRQRTRNKKDGI
jgi:sodium/proline symporter